MADAVEPVDRIEPTERTIGGRRVSLLEAGRGGRPLLLAHGFTGAKEDFADSIGAFAAEGWWVIAPDLRGHGSSDKPNDEDLYSLAIYSQDLCELADDLGWDRFALLGHSMGGMVAQHLVLDVPDRVERLVLMDTCHGPVEGLDEGSVALAVGILREQGLPALLDLIAQLPAAPKAPSEIRLLEERPGHEEFGQAKVRCCSAAMYAAMGQELLRRTDRLAELATVDVPVRVVVGEEDRGFIGPSRRMAEAIPGADLVVIPDAAHSPQFENPEAWWGAVAPFLAAGQLVD